MESILRSSNYHKYMSIIIIIVAMIVTDWIQDKLGAKSIKLITRKGDDNEQYHF